MFSLGHDCVVKRCLPFQLLFCGSDEYSVEDLKKNHVLESGGSYNFKTVTMPRFWSIISSFTNDDMARWVEFFSN